MSCTVKCPGKYNNEQPLTLIQEGPRLAKHTYTTKSPLLQWKCVESVGEVDGQRRLNPEGDTRGEI